MTKKLLAILFAALMVITLLAGCQTTKVYYSSVDGEADDEYAEEVITDGTNEKGEKVTRVVTKTKKVKTTKGQAAGNVGGGVATRKTKAQGQAMKYTPVADAGADYSVKGEVTIAVDMFRPTDYDAMFDVMEQLFPNVTIKLDMHQTTDGKDNAGVYLSTRMSTDTAADIVWDDASNVLNYADKGWVYPLNDFIRNDPEAKYIPANLRNDYTYDGYLYALPHQAVFEVTVFNNNLLSQAGLKLPALDWGYADYAKYLEAGKNLYSKGLAVAVPSFGAVFDKRYAWACALQKDPNGNYGAYGINMNKLSFDEHTLKETATQINNWRKTEGVEGYYMSISKTGGISDLQNKLGISKYGTLFDVGKALMFDTQDSKIYTNYRNKWKFDYTMWPAPTVNGRQGVHVDHCVITTNCDKANLPAAWQLLRFMTYSTNGNLARLSMYKTENKKLYALNSRLYYPTTTNPTVVKAFEGLPSATNVDKYMLSCLSKSGRIDAYKLIPNYNQNWANCGVETAFQQLKNGTGGGDLNEAVDDLNKLMQKEVSTARASAKKKAEATGVKPN